MEEDIVGELESILFILLSHYVDFYLSLPHPPQNVQLLLYVHSHMYNSERKVHSRVRSFLCISMINNPPRTFHANFMNTLPSCKPEYVHPAMVHTAGVEPHARLN